MATCTKNAVKAVVIDQSLVSPMVRGFLLALGLAFALSLPHVACRTSSISGEELPPPTSSELLQFSTLSDQLQFADAGYGASLLLTDERGLKGSVVFRANENGVQKLYLVEFDAAAAQLKFNQQVLAEGVGEQFKLCLNPVNKRRVVVGPLLQPGGTAFASLWAEGENGNWRQYYLDETDDNGRYIACAIDQVGGVHVAYTASASQTLRYVLWQDGILLTQPERIVTVDHGFEEGQIGADGSIDSSVSLALNADGLPRISYYDSSNGQLRLASQSGADFSWKIQVVGQSNSKQVLSVAANGVGTINEGFIPRKSQITLYKNLTVLSDEAYTIESRTQIRIIDYDPSAEYQIDYISPISLDYGVWSSLAIATAGDVYLAIYDFRGGRMLLATNTDPDAGGAWQVETIDDEGIVGGSHDLKLMPFFDNTGVQRGQMPVVVYQDVGNSDLLLAYRGQQQWLRRRLSSVGLTGFGPSMQLTNDGNAVIAYREHRLETGFPASLQVTRALPIQP